MPLTSLTCPICLAVLKPKAPVAEGSRVRCPKCKGSFVAEGEPKEEKHEPDLAQEPMPEAADKPAEEEPLEEVEAVEEVTEAPPRKRRDRQRDDEDDRPRRRARDEEVDEAEERPRKKKRTKGGLPMWAWFAISGGAFLVMCCGCGIPGGIIAWNWMSGLSVNMDNYDKIQGNMTEAQVKDLLGQPTASVGFFGTQNETWTSGDYFITVNFRNGRAVIKSCRLPFAGGVGTTERTDPLGP